MTSPPDPGAAEHGSDPDEGSSRRVVRDPPDPAEDEHEVTADRPTTPADRRRHAGHDVTLLPDLPAEETDEGWGERSDATDDDRLWRDRPPHHLP